MIWGWMVQGAMVRILFPVEWYLQTLSAPDGLASHLLDILREPAFREAFGTRFFCWRRGHDGR
jgi:hypothetical protein